MYLKIKKCLHTCRQKRCKCMPPHHAEDHWAEQIIPQSLKVSIYLISHFLLDLIWQKSLFLLLSTLYWHLHLLHLASLSFYWIHSAQLVMMWMMQEFLCWFMQLLQFVCWMRMAASPSPQRKGQLSCHCYQYDHTWAKAAIGVLIACMCHVEELPSSTASLKHSNIVARSELPVSLKTLESPWM